MNNMRQLDNTVIRNEIVSFLIILTVFLIPLSSTGKSIVLPFALAAIMFTPYYYRQFASVLRKPWCIATMLFVGFIILACLWSPNSEAECLFSIKKYAKFLYLPILAVGFTIKKTRSYSLYAFIIAMFITSSLGVLSYHGFISQLTINPDFIFRNHIMTGIMIAYASYLSLLLLWKSKKAKLAKGMLVISILVFTYYLLFINQGRTGFVIEGLLLGLFIVQFCRWQTALLLGCLGVTIGVTAYFTVSTIHTRVSSVIREAKTYKTDKAASMSSVGFRLRFHDFAHELYNNHPIMGNGTASFPYYFATLAPVKEWSGRLQEPHSQYWLIAVEQGLVGLALLGGLFITILQTIWDDKMTRAIGLGIMLPFLIGNLSDSLLFYSGSGYCFLIFIALCLGKRLEKQNYPTHYVSN